MAGVVPQSYYIALIASLLWGCSEFKPAVEDTRTKVKSSGNNSPQQNQGTNQTPEDERVEEGAGLDHPDPTITPLCQSFIDSLPTDMEKGFLQVPENWDEPNGEKVQVFYYSRKYTGESAARRVPVVFFNGGPGGASHSSYELLKSYESKHPVRFVFLDQRGNGCSSLYPTGNSPEVINRLHHYGSRGIVRDAEAVRIQLLGKDAKWHAFGQSYGSFIVHRYTEIAPNYLSGAFAHGFAFMDDPLEVMVLRSKAQKEVGDIFLNQNPGDREILTRAREVITINDCYGTNGKICGPAVLDGLYFPLGFSTDWPNIHSAVVSLLDPTNQPNKTLLDFIADTFILGAVGPVDPATVSWGSHVIAESEITPGIATSDDPTGCNKIIAQLELGGISLNDIPFSECRLNLAMYNQQQAPPFAPLVAPAATLLLQDGTNITRDPVSLDKIAENLSTHPDLKFHLYSGKHDSFAPYTIFGEEVEKLKGKIVYQEFLTSGHEGFHTEARVWQDLTAP